MMYDMERLSTHQVGDWISMTIGPNKSAFFEVLSKTARDGDVAGITIQKLFEVPSRKPHILRKYFETYWNKERWRRAVAEASRQEQARRSLNEDPQ